MGVFDEKRFSAILGHIVREYNEPLDQYDMVKVHVLTDFFHVLGEGEPVIGGTPRILPYGPVIQEAYDTVQRWISHGGEFSVVASYGNRMQLAPNSQDDSEWDSLLWGEAQAAAVKAWETHAPMGFKNSQKFFHDPSQYFGAVWSKHSNRWGTPINWVDVIESYEKITGEDHGEAKALASTPTHDQLMEVARAYPAPAEFWGD